MSIYPYDHQILARSREIMRQSFELLRWSEAYVRRGDNRTGESVEPKNDAGCTDETNGPRSPEKGG